MVPLGRPYSAAPNDDDEEVLLVVGFLGIGEDDDDDGSCFGEGTATADFGDDGDEELLRGMEA